MDGLLSSLAHMSRTEFTPNLKVAELTEELHVLILRWRRNSATHDSDHLVQDSEKHPQTQERYRYPARSSETKLPELPQGARTPLSASYNKSSIGMQLHPITKHLTYCCTKPDRKMIFLSNSCSQYTTIHFDFGHDALRTSALAHFHIDEEGYKKWKGDSDTVDHDTIMQKLN